jgi:SAM-dependent methyltransferase
MGAGSGWKVTGPVVKDPLSLYDRLYLRLFYLRRSFRYDLPENQAGWRSRKNQELRFRALMGVGDLVGQRVLDLGCGLGCLYGYLRASGWSGEYTGIDLLGPMVRKARRRFPGVEFERRDILRDPPRRKWDFALINGVFNHKVRDNWGWIEAMVKTALSMAEKGVAFNLLDRDQGWMDEDLFYASPSEALERAAAWSEGKARLVTGYLPEDMTLILTK